ncbi:crustacyanin-C1 subunit-like [Penaeus japonicus]|uniref:crustacyanin-C1 subunit-like n=1 Tax=Penaeus japonicus TaxID=27405 RepID=UPI001C71453B|nr:crustacyanin-C1 subunit-like [Penaeus japonicus]XP_042856888.1 crustacyanin-C1 subunit-like [Penaeus japonicus]
MKSSLIVLALVAVVAADKIPDFVVPGKCPAVDKKALFDSQKPNYPKFSGVWYEIALTKNPYQLLQQCVRNEFSFDGKKFTAKSTGINADGNLMRRNGQIVAMPLGDPNLSIDYEGSFMAPFVILDTDYENFACIHSCVDFNQGYFTDFAFIFSRSPSMSAQHLKQCETAFKNVGFDNSRFVKTVQGASCPYETQKAL